LNISISFLDSTVRLVMDGLTLDQVTVFVAVAEAGSFSAAARKLNRAQSAITYTIQNLELQVGIDLFDRSAYRPTLTEAGRVLLPRARRLLEGLTDFRKQSSALLAGVEARLTIAVDVMMPASLLTTALKDFNVKYPMVEVALLAQPMEATLAALREGSAEIGMVVDVPMPGLLDGFDRIRCGKMSTVLVAAPDHPLAKQSDPIRPEDLRDHTQILLSSGVLGGAKDWGAQAVNRWRVNDLGLRHALLLAGVGWSSMPHHLVEKDLASGLLVALSLSPTTAAELPMPMPLSVAHLSSRVLGPAGRWLFGRLAEG
jgi:DNA-binding transcriptional LysR family regulator